jgi:hypothetical protein
MRSNSRGNFILAIVSGVIIYSSVYISFSLTPVIPLAFMFMACDAFFPKSEKGKMHKFFATLAGILLGMIASDLLFRVFLRYDIGIRYTYSISAHHYWNITDPRRQSHVYYALVNPIEYAVWIGIPVTCFCVGATLRTARNIVNKRVGIADMQLISIILIFLILDVIIWAKGEVARLWLFMVPLVCMIVANEISARFPQQAGRMFKLLIFLQLVTTYLIKKHQDLWLLLKP